MNFLKTIKISILSFIFIVLSFSIAFAAGNSGQISVIKDGLPLSGADVEAFGKVVTTDDKGIARFDSMTNGTQDVVVRYAGKEYKNTINVSSSNINIQVNDAYSSNIASTQSDSLNLNLDVPIVVLLSGVVLLVLGIKLFYDRVKNLDYRSRILAHKLELSLGGVATFVFILGIFTQILFVSNNNSSYILNETSNAATSNLNCLCNVNVCSTSCSFDKYSDVKYSTSISCNREKGISSSEPTAVENNSFCTRSLRTKGDADGDNIIEVLDYMYYVRIVNGGSVSARINPDFNGDGVISRTDRDIIVKSLLTNSL